MAEYIEREGFSEVLETAIKMQELAEKMMDAEDDPELQMSLKVYNDILNGIKEFPTADVLPVVRCRECRFAPSGSDDSVEQGFGLKWPDDNWPYHTNPCPYWCEDEYYSHKPEPDFFCAFGKCKDGGKDNG